MATRGRKPTPTAIKELEGNPGKRPLNKNEPKPTKKAPPCPKWLEPEAKKEWHRPPEAASLRRTIPAGRPMRWRLLYGGGQSANSARTVRLF